LEGGAERELSEKRMNLGGGNFMFARLVKTQKTVMAAALGAVEGLSLIHI